MQVGLYHERAASSHAGGIGVYVREMAAAVERATGHDAVLFAWADDLAASIREGGVDLVALRPALDPGLVARLGRRLPVAGTQKLEKLATLAGAARDGSLGAADVVVTHHYLDDLVVSRAAPAPTVYQYHGLRAVGAGARARERLSATGWHLANSEQTAREAAGKLGRTVDAVVRPGVDAERFAPGADPAFERSAPVVLFVGRLVAAKGVYDLLAATARLERDVSVHLVGRGELAAVRERARDLGVADAVTVAGPVAHDDLPGYYAAADVACVPSRYESFGMANLEAMACGTPVVATDACGLDGLERGAAVVPAGDPAALADRLDALLADPDRRAALGRAGLAVAREHTWDRQAERLAAFCEQIA